MNAVSTMNQLKITHRQKFSPTIKASKNDLSAKMASSNNYPVVGDMFFSDTQANNSMFCVQNINKYLVLSDTLTSKLEKNNKIRAGHAREYKEQVYKLCNENNFSLEDAYKKVDAEWNKKTSVLNDISWADYDKNLREENIDMIADSVNEMVEKVNPEVLDELYGYAVSQLVENYFQATQFKDSLNGDLDYGTERKYRSYVDMAEDMIASIQKVVGGNIGFKIESSGDKIVAKLSDESLLLLDENKKDVVKSLLTSLVGFRVETMYEDKVYESTKDIDFEKFESNTPKPSPNVNRELVVEEREEEMVREYK